jgi:acetolactate synthase-1/2/3 large subunit
MPVLTGAHALAESLLRAGTKRIYGIVGTTLVGFLNGLYDYRDKLQYVSCRHEMVAGGMADAEARVTGRPGVFVVHGGPGALNAALALAVAQRDCSPVVCIAGGVPREIEGFRGMSQLDQAQAHAATTKAVLRADSVADIPARLVEAFRTAASGCPGPVLLEVPQDLWDMEGEVGLDGLRFERNPPPAPSDGDVDAILGDLRKAERPLLLAGGGVISSGGWDELKRFAEAWKLPVATTGNGRGALPEDHPLCLGKAGYAGGTYAADYALEHADYVLCVGCGISDMTTYHVSSPVPGRVAMVNLDPDYMARQKASLSSPVARTITADARLFLQLAAARPAGPGNRDAWRAALDPQKRKWERSLDAFTARPKGALAGKVMVALRKVLPRDAIVVGGAGLHLIYAMDYLPALAPRSFLYSNNYGAMGFGLAAAMGAKMAHPEREVVAVLGDGELMMMGLGDLETAVRHSLKIRAFVVNDNSYRVLRATQAIQYKGRFFGTEHKNPDFVKLAQAFGATGVRIDSPEKIDAGLEEALGAPGPALVEIPTDPNDLPPTNIEAVLRMRQKGRA